MANKFEVQVVALDRFTKTFRDLNNRASKAARPLVNVQRQVGALGRELHLDKAAKAMGKVSDAAVTVSRTLGLSLGPLEAVLGAGGIIGGLLAAGGAAIALGVNFARTGFEVSRTSQAIGVSTKDLQLWRGAMQLAGVDASVATQTLAGLGRTLQDARFGRDPVALQVLRQLGTGIPMKNGIVDQVAALEGIARALSKISDPQMRATLADALHIPPEALPALIQGAEAMERLRAKAQELGVVFSENDLKASNDFTTSLNLLKVAAQGAGNSLGSTFLPPMAKALDYMTRMLAQSGKSSTGAAGTGIWDFIAAGPRAVGWLGSTLLHGNAPTTPAQRSVRGVITDAPGQATASTPPEGVHRTPSEQQMANQMAFTPAELARQQASEDSDENRRELMREIQRTRDPAARGVLQGELSKMDARLHVDVTLKGMPAGTSATARVASADHPNATARVQFAMPTGDMP